MSNSITFDGREYAVVEVQEDATPPKGKQARFCNWKLVRELLLDNGMSAYQCKFCNGVWSAHGIGPHLKAHRGQTLAVPEVVRPEPVGNKTVKQALVDIGEYLVPVGDWTLQELVDHLKMAAEADYTEFFQWKNRALDAETKLKHIRDAAR